MARSYCKEESLGSCGGRIATALGPSACTAIDLVSRQAQEKGLAVFLVGGVVRDLILGMRNVDLDFCDRRRRNFLCQLNGSEIRRGRSRLTRHLAPPSG